MHFSSTRNKIKLWKQQNAIWAYIQKIYKKYSCAMPHENYTTDALKFHFGEYVQFFCK